MLLAVLFRKGIDIRNDLCCHLDDVTLSNYIILNSLSDRSNIWVVPKSISMNHFVFLTRYFVLFFLDSLVVT